jgi:hypothetical protein
MRVLQSNWAEIDSVEFVARQYESVAKNVGYWQATAQAEGDGWIICYLSGATNSTAQYGTPTYRYLWTHIPVDGYDGPRARERECVCVCAKLEIDLTIHSVAK